MGRVRWLLLVGLVAVGSASFFAATSIAQAALGPLYDIHTTWADQNLHPGEKGVFYVQVRNIGDASGSEDLKIEDHLPEGVVAKRIEFHEVQGELGSTLCTGVGTSTATCTVEAKDLGKLNRGAPPGVTGETFVLLPTGYLPEMRIDVAVSPSASGAGTNTATVSGGSGPGPVTEADEIPFGENAAGFGSVPSHLVSDTFNAEYPFGNPSRQAGDHPYEQRVAFDLNGQYEENNEGDPIVGLHGSLRTVELTLPRGMVGNPEATPKCPQVKFAESGATLSGTACPPQTQVGYVNIKNPSLPAGQLSRIPIYNLQPPKGQAADFAFNAGGFVQAHIYPSLDPAQNYAIKTVTPEISNLVKVVGSEVTFWGVPGDPSHQKYRFFSAKQPGDIAAGAPWGSTPIRPLLTNPTDCGFDNGGARMRVGSYSEPGVLTPIQEYSNLDNVNGCSDPRFRFEPQIALQPTDLHAGAPTGLNVHLEVPQRNDEVEDAKELYAENGFVKGISTPPMKKAIVTFPEGMTLSPSAAQGLGSCTPEQIGLGTNQPVTCPDDSQYGTLILHTPILPENNPPKGFIYIAKQNDNPFHDFLSLYLVIEEPERGILVKIPGRVDLDPKTGQITTSFDELPQFPVSDMQMNFKGGARAALVNPSTCGRKTIRAEFFSWADPSTPHVLNSSYDVTQKPDGSPCVNSLAERQFKPQLETGTISNSAGAYSPFVLRLSRTDDDQEFSQLGVKLPEGLVAKFAGVGICSDAGISQALSRETVAGDGALEQADPSCPASSQIGTTEVGTGVGVPLSWVPGNAYLAGPYHGAPLSLVVISPAVVGPYDLGVITVRTAVNVNSETAQGEALSDPFPQIFQGIPVRIRDIRLRLDRAKFTSNPTSCAEKQIHAHVTGTGGNLESTADDTGIDLTERFQAADCASLGFTPKLAFRLFGGIKRGAHPRFQAKLRMPEGGANIDTAAVTLPHALFLDQSHIKTVCTRVQFRERNCPGASVYGFAEAKTPLFEQPLKGPVYLRSSSHKLPDLVAALRGPDSQPVEVDLDGRIDSSHGGIRNTFEVVPDAPVSEFTLTMQGGKKGLLQNSTNLCAKANLAIAKFTAQNGKTLTLRPELKSSCAKHKRRAKGH
jgi:hypothetical protein